MVKILIKENKMFILTEKSYNIYQYMEKEGLSTFPTPLLNIHLYTHLNIYFIPTENGVYFYIYIIKVILFEHYSKIFCNVLKFPEKRLKN